MEQRDNQVEQHMENTSNTQQGERAEGWPALPYEAWRDTCQPLHLWTQIVGKVRMEGNMRTIGHEELKQKLDRNVSLKACQQAH